jgi:hypothetical protein
MQLEQLHADCLSHIFSQFDLWDTKTTMALLQVSKMTIGLLIPWIKEWLKYIVMEMDAIDEEESEDRLCHIFKCIMNTTKKCFNPLESVYHIHQIMILQKQPHQFNIISSFPAGDFTPVKVVCLTRRLVKIQYNRVTFVEDWLLQQCRTIADIRVYLPYNVSIAHVSNSVKDDELCKVNYYFRLELRFEIRRARINSF